MPLGANTFDGGQLKAFKTINSPKVALVISKHASLKNTQERLTFDDPMPTLQETVLSKLDAIRNSCVEWSEKQIQQAKKVHMLLCHAESLLSIRKLPSNLEDALKGFDKSALLSVMKIHEQNGAQQVARATKIRAFRKYVLPRVAADAPNHISTLAELFPDLLLDTIQQMYTACANDLHSCFEVLSGLSDYTVQERPLQTRKRTTYNSVLSDSESEDEMFEPLYAMQGFLQRKPSFQVMIPLNQTFFTIPQCSTIECSSKYSESTKLALANAMHDFENGQDFEAILNGYNAIVEALGIEMSVRRDISIYRVMKHGVRNQLTYRQSRIFDILDTKLRSHLLYKQHAAASRRVCIVGAGPVGLRTAIELAMLGAEVVVLEKRPSFIRENILHLFPWVVHDLTRLGAKVFYNQFCTSSVYFHIGTRQLQCILLKVALLLGVNVYGHTSFDTAIPTNNGYKIVTTPPLPQELENMTALIGAGGMYDTVGALANIQRSAFSPSPAYGVLGWVRNTRTKEENQVSEFSWGYQYNQKMFGELRDQGLDLENAVYYRGEVHYVVMTPKGKNLFEQGVLKTNKTPLVHPDNIDKEKLNQFVTKAFKFFKIPMQAPLESASVFDFSRTLRADKASAIIQGDSSKLYVALVGDALMEPFWPQGLGINRGFLSALDTAFAITQLDKQDDATVLLERENNYKRSAALHLDNNIHK
ncbi:hypothetical protein THRCLA_04888 [Thraustotheca clavata]|uniref:Uncharacterized protein n=1 Tax=Thraustotheca clavata TaxID=74557 RepID=A0A1V9ZXM3_9STRA|nr:hypothetical protein THRCLA_04888 [Thraustotheca clavata]